MTKRRGKFSTPQERLSTFCRPCGKVAYPNRSAAKQERNRLAGGGTLSIYPCPEGNGLHIGHMPGDVRNGTLDKDDYLDRLRD